MAKKQHRRSVSMRPEVFVRIRERARAMGVPMTQWVERALTDRLDDLGVPHMERREALSMLAGKPRRERTEEDIEEMRRRAFGG